MEKIMTIEIGNSITQGLPPAPGEETQSGAAQKNRSAPQQETGKPEDTITLSENAQRFAALQESISSEPVHDTKRIEAAMQKIKNGELDILSDNVETRLESSEKIAQRLLSIDQELPVSKS